LDKITSIHPRAIRAKLTNLIAACTRYCSYLLKLK